MKPILKKDLKSIKSFKKTEDSTPGRISLAPKKPSIKFKDITINVNPPSLPNAHPPKISPTSIEGRVSKFTEGDAKSNLQPRKSMNSIGGESKENHGQGSQRSIASKSSLWTGEPQGRKISNLQEKGKTKSGATKPQESGKPKEEVQKKKPSLRKTLSSENVFESKLKESQSNESKPRGSLQKQFSMVVVNEFNPELDPITELELDNDDPFSPIRKPKPIPKPAELSPRLKDQIKRSSEQYDVAINELFKKNIDLDDKQKMHDTFLMIIENLTFEMNRAIIYNKQLDATKEDLDHKIKEYNELLRVHGECEDKFRKMSVKIMELKQDRDKLMEEIVNLQAKLEPSVDGEVKQSLGIDKLDLKSTKLAKRKSTAAHRERNKINELVNLFGKRDDITFSHQNHAKQLVGVLSAGSFTQFKNPMPLKTVLKTISTIYSEKIKDTKKSSELKKQDFDEYVYDYYMQVFGIKEIGEKKFCYFILSLKYHAQYFRVHLFSRFMGIVGGIRYNQEQILKYLEGVEYLETSQKGYSVKNLDTSARMMYPYIRAEDYIRAVFDKKLTLEEMYEFKKRMEEFREEDKTERNIGLIDGDIFLEKVIDKYGSIINRTKQYVVDAFDSCDLDGNKTCSVNEWVLLCRYIEPETFDLNSCIELFFHNANKQIKGENCMTFDKFAAVCTDNNLFTDEKQKTFLGVSETRTISQVFSELRDNWSHRFKELEEKLNSLKSLAEEETFRWLDSLKVLNDHFLYNTVSSYKSTAIAYYLTYKELQRISREEEIETHVENSEDY